MSSNPKLDVFLPRLKQVTKNCNGWEACCPAHDDTRPSLSIHVNDDGKILLKCQSNSCHPANIMQCVGMFASDLSPPKQDRGRSKWGDLVKTYSYCDENNVPLFEVCRFEKAEKLPDGSFRTIKTFRQRHRVAGDWVWKMAGVRRTLYRLPQLLAKKEEPVFVVEGEKQVEYLESLGLVATCNPQGAGKWKDEFAECLRGRDVVVIPDNDPLTDQNGITHCVGFEHAETVADSLTGKAKSVHVLILPDAQQKWGLDDWLQKGGHKLDELEELLANATPWVRGAKLFDRTSADPDGHRLVGCSDRDSAIITSIQNFEMIEVEADGDSEAQFISEALPITAIMDIISKLTGGWPRCVGGSLFVPNDGRPGVSWIPDTDALFAYFGRATGHPPEFKGMPGHHTKRELFADMLRTAKQYEAVEELPHEPPMPGHYYACEMPSSGNGERLNELVNRFSPETDTDRDFILAAFVTPFWGGCGGTRPAFCITSDAGKGCGKSTLAACIGWLAGGALDVSANEDIATIKSRLLSPEGITKRVVWLDNVKSHRLSWAELESLITTPNISGKRMYVGEAQRPNTLTFILTMNGVSLSTDMAQRSVLIKLKRPDYSGTWAEETRNFIELHRRELVADVLGFLRSPVTALSKHTRWGDWERDILARLPEPSEAQAVIRERQVGVDVDGEESALIEEFFAKQLARLCYDTTSDRVFIPSSVAARWFCWATNERLTVTKSSRTLKQRITEGQLRRLLECSRRDLGRGFEFWGDDATGETYLRRDIEDQIRIRGENQTA